MNMVRGGSPPNGVAFKAGLMLYRVKDSSSETQMNCKDLDAELEERNLIVCRVRMNACSYTFLP